MSEMRRLTLVKVRPGDKGDSREPSFRIYIRRIVRVNAPFALINHRCPRVRPTCKHCSCDLLRRRIPDTGESVSGSCDARTRG